MQCAAWQEVSQQLDALFFMPFAPQETPELRSQSIESYLHSVGWNWDAVLTAQWLEDKN